MIGLLGSTIYRCLPIIGRRQTQPKIQPGPLRISIYLILYTYRKHLQVPLGDINVYLKNEATLITRKKVFNSAFAPMMDRFSTLSQIGYGTYVCTKLLWRSSVDFSRLSTLLFKKGLQQCFRTDDGPV